MNHVLIYLVVLLSASVSYSDPISFTSVGEEFRPPIHAAPPVERRRLEPPLARRANEYSQAAPSSGQVGNSDKKARK